MPAKKVKKLSPKEIELLVRARKNRSALAAIKYHFSRPASAAELNAIIDWLKRLGLYREGLHFLQKQIEFTAGKKDELHRKLIQLELARLYYTIGANSYSSRILASLDLKTWGFYKTKAENALANFQYSIAQKNYELYLATYPYPNDYSYRLAQLSFADALIGLQQFERAIDIVKDVLKNSTETMALAIANSCMGEYLARQNHCHEALIFLERAIALMPEDHSMDAAILHKWYGFSLFQMGKRKRGAIEIKIAKKNLRSIGHRVEAQIDLSIREFELGIIEEKALGKRLLYPGLNKSLLEQYQAIIPSRISGKNPLLVIDLPADEYYVRRQPSLGIPLEILALAFLRLAEDLGISKYRLTSLLWPEDYQSPDLLESRLSKIFSRLKKLYKLEIQNINGVFFLPKSKVQKIEVIVRGTSLPSLLRTSPFPSAIQIQSHYQVSRSQSWVIKKNFGNLIRHR